MWYNTESSTINLSNNIVYFLVYLGFLVYLELYISNGS